MSDIDPQRVKDIFQEALELPPEERGTFLDAACGDDQRARTEVEALLASHGDAGAFLYSPTLGGETSGPFVTAELTEGPGSQIGRYKLLQLIGEGGFGSVFMAEQEEPVHRRVALKIIKLGMDTKEVIARFEAERQALAMMEQPNIAKLLDAGATETGRPYFVMELVRGVPITEYCDAAKASTRERLDLFIQVCRAIEHAHAKGIIHRDLKPSNVLVTLHDGVPVPKVIDFGVAKATNQRLTEKTLFTRYGEFIGTPMYMSPEQAEMSGLDVDKRSDIYSLGVLLYELLSGTTPYDETALRSVALVEMLRYLQEQEPPTPSARLKTLGNRLSEIAGRRGVEPNALSRLLRGDLDWIVMTAMEKDRQRRYATAAAMAEDIERYLDGDTVRATPPSLTYRMGKIVRKRKAPLAVAASVGVLTISGVFGPWGTLAVPESEGVPTRRLVRDTGEGLDGGRVTADGTHILRYNGVERGFELIDIASQDSRILTTDGPNPDRVAPRGQMLSPDGAWVAAILTPTDSATLSEITPGGRSPTTGKTELRLFAVDGRGDGRALFGWMASEYSLVRPFAWSSDGSRIWIWGMRRDRSAEIASVSLEGTFQVLKTIRWRNHTQAPSLSPDGRFVAYHDADRRDAPADLFVLAADGSSEARIEHPADDLKPMFAPDGTGLVFESNRRDGVRDLWFLPLRDGRPFGEPRAVWYDIAPYGVARVFGENGSLFYRFAETDWELFITEIDLAARKIGTPVRIERRDHEMNGAPAFSLDGRYLAHMRDRGRRLVLRTLDTGFEQEIPMPRALRWPSIDWCASGEQLFVTGWADVQVVLRIDLHEGGTERVPISEPERVFCLGDGTEIVYLQAPAVAGAPRRLVRRSLTAGSETTVAEGNISPYRLSLSYDETTVAFVQSDSSDGRLAVQPIGGVSRTVADAPLGRGDDFAGIMWLPGDEALLVLRQAGEASEGIIVSRVPVDGSAETAIGRMPQPALEGQGFYGAFFHSMHPSGKMFAFQQHAGLITQVWAIDNLMEFIQSGKTAPLEPTTHRP